VSYLYDTRSFRVDQFVPLQSPVVRFVGLPQELAA
jgi:hypothetical protein